MLRTNMTSLDHQDVVYVLLAAHIWVQSHHTLTSLGGVADVGEHSERLTRPLFVLRPLVDIILLQDLPAVLDART